jgi:negative regulator of flagellin synthesis FlgM
MSFVDGIGNQQQTISSITSSVATPTLQTTASSGEANESTISGSNMQHADEATLSATAGLVAQSLKGSDVRSEKVASLQQAIAAGSYSVLSSAVADKIIQSLSEE